MNVYNADIVARRCVEVFRQRLVARELRKIIPAITFARRGEIEKYLKRYRLDLERGDYRCAMCGERVTEQNLGILISREDKVIVVCNIPECMAKANILTLYVKASRA